MPVAILTMYATAAEEVVRLADLAARRVRPTPARFAVLGSYNFV